MSRTRTIFLHGPQLIGAVYHPAGSVLDVEEGRARALVESGHAADFARSDGHGSGTISLPSPAPAGAEVAALDPSPRRAARPASKAARRLAATSPGA